MNPLRQPLLRLGLFLASLGLGLAVASPAEALHLEARMGFEGYHRPGEWAPLQVTLENLPRTDRHAAPKARTGRVEVVADSVGSAAPAVLYSYDVEVAPNDRKVVDLAVRFPSNQMRARVRFAVGREELAGQDITLRPLGPTESLAVVIQTTDEDIVIPALNRESPTYTIKAAPDQLPTLWTGFSAADLIILPRVTERALDDGRGEALAQWVQQGGTLLVLSGRWGSTLRGTALDPLLPAQPGSAVPYEVDNGRLSPLVTPPDGFLATTSALLLAPLQVHNDSTTLVLSLEGLPLLLSRPHGLGQIWFWSGEWNRQLLQLYPLPRYLSGWLATRANLDHVRVDFNDRLFYTNLPSLLGSWAADSLPSTSFIFWVLLLYFLLIGPLNFLVLWWFKKLEWAWITIPVVVVAFGVGLLIAGEAIRGGRSVWRTFELVTLQSGQIPARSDLLALQYSSQTGEAQLASSPQPMAQSAHAAGARGNEVTRMVRLFANQSPRAVLGEERPDFRVSSTDGLPRLQTMPLRAWDTTFLRSEGPISLCGPITSSISLEGSTIQVTLTNNSQRTLNRPLVILGNRSWPLTETLEPGQTTSRSLPLRAPDGVVGTDDRIFGANLSRQSIQEAAETALIQSLGEPDYPHLTPFLHEGLIAAALSRPYQTLEAPVPPTDESHLAWVIVKTPVTLTGQPQSQQWFGPRPLTEAPVLTGAQGIMGVSMAQYAPNTEQMWAIRGFQRQAGRALTKTLQLRVAGMGTPATTVVNTIRMEALEWQTGRWINLPLRDHQQSFPLAPRSRSVTGFLPAANTVDLLVQIPPALRNPLDQGAIVRIASERPIRTLGPFLRLTNPLDSSTP